MRIADAISVSIVVSIPDCHSGDRGSMPRLRELFDDSSLNQIWSTYELKSKATKRGHTKQIKNNENNTLQTLLQKTQNSQ